LRLRPKMTAASAKSPPSPIHAIQQGESVGAHTGVGARAGQMQLLLLGGTVGGADGTHVGNEVVDGLTVGAPLGC